MNISPVSLQSTVAFNITALNAGSAQAKVIFSASEQQPKETKQEKLFGIKKFILPMLFLSFAFPAISAIKGYQKSKLNNPVIKEEEKKETGAAPGNIWESLGRIFLLKSHQNF